MDATSLPHPLACADADDNAIRILMPQAARAEAKKASSRLASSIGLLASCAHRVRSPAQIQRPTTQQVARLRSTLRTTARCGAAPAARKATSRTAPVERVLSGEDAIKWASQSVFHSWRGALIPEIVRVGLTRWATAAHAAARSPPSPSPHAALARRLRTLRRAPTVTLTVRTRLLHSFAFRA